MGEGRGWTQAIIACCNPARRCLLALKCKCESVRECMHACVCVRLMAEQLLLMDRHNEVRKRVSHVKNNGTPDHLYHILPRAKYANGFVCVCITSLKSDEVPRTGALEGPADGQDTHSRSL